MGSSVPAVTDYLVACATQATAPLPEEWIVADGWPASIGPRMFGIGMDRPPSDAGGEGLASQGTIAPKDLGAYTFEETYTVPLWILDSSGGTKQSPLRLAVFAAWNAFFDLVHADLTLGGLVAPYPALLDSLRQEVPGDTTDAADGRYCLLLSSLTVQNRFTRSA